MNSRREVGRGPGIRSGATCCRRPRPHQRDASVGAPEPSASRPVQAPRDASALRRALVRLCGPMALAGDRVDSTRGPGFDTVGSPASQRCPTSALRGARRRDDGPAAHGTTTTVEGARVAPPLAERDLWRGREAQSERALDRITRRKTNQSVLAVWPPSTTTTLPVMNAPASDASKRSGPSRSSGRPSRRCGMRASSRAPAGDDQNARLRSVST